MKRFLEKLESPEVKYRSLPFWSWNERLRENELREQIRLMAEAGEGGFFMHARGGLETPYLGDEWFDSVRACADEASRLGLDAWCYDELDWPSGSCGGAVPALGEEYCVRWLRIRECTNGETQGDVIAFYGIKDDGSYRYLADSYDEAKPLLGEDETLKYATSFADDSYFDILNPKAVRAFIDSTYEKYADECAKEFENGSLKGFFTDEPQYALCKTPWSVITLEEFERTYGYSLKEHIPALLIGRDGHEKIRFDFWKMVNRLFTESFAKQIYDWCNEHDCALTGHAMMEDSLICQIHCTAGCMPMYEYMHIPGMDWLGRSTARDRISGELGVPVQPLQVGSVAAQLGKPHVLTETYAMSGWDISFAEMRHLVEWQFLGGVNLVCQHLQPYTLRGRRKNDYPPAMFYQSPWWDEYRAVTDAQTRIGKILADGKYNPDVLVIHPMHSVWLKYTNDDMNAESDIDHKFLNMSLRLAQAHLPYHFGDETIIARHGRVEGDRFTVGEMTYNTVLLPEIYGLDRTTYELLLTYAENGGRIALLGCEPKFIDGVESPEEIAELLKYCEWIDLHNRESGNEDLMRYIRRHKLSSVSIVGADGEEKCIQVCRRDFAEDGITAYFMVNFDTECAHRVSVTVDGDEAAELRAEAMTRHKIKSKRNGDGTVTLSLTFAPYESKLILVGDGVAEDALPATEPRGAKIELDPVITRWQISTKDGNCLILEKVQIGDGTEWSEPIHGMRLGGALRRGEYKDAEPQLRYEFTVSEDADLAAMSDVKLVTEAGYPCTVIINGSPATYEEGEWWLDHTFSVFGIGAGLRHGKNEVILTGFCHKEIRDGEEIFVPTTDFTFAYLKGTFGVYFLDDFTQLGGGVTVTGDRFILGDMPTEVWGDDVVTQGLPFFRGKLTLTREVGIDSADLPHYIDLSGMAAVCARVSVNGKRGELIGWGSMTEDVTDRLVSGKNTISVELTISNRNLLGPHHRPDAAVRSPGPGEFEPSVKRENWRGDRYSFIAAGLGR